MLNNETSSEGMEQRGSFNPLLAVFILIGLVILVSFGTYLQSESHKRPMGAVPSNGAMVGIYNATPTDMGLADGYGSAISVDRSGRVIPAPFSYYATSSRGTRTIKNVAGTLHSVTVSSLAGATPSFVIYDNTAGSGTIIASFASSTGQGTYDLDVAFSTGLTVVIATGGSPKLTFSYR